jgi:hypothetical protein
VEVSQNHFDIWTPPTNALFTSPATAALNCPRPVIMSGICGSAQAARALGHPSGGHLLLPTSFLQNSLHIALDARGPAVDVSNSGGGHCQKSRQQPPGGLPSMSSPSVVPDLPPAPPRGPAIVVFNSSGDRCRTYRQHPPGGPPSTSLTPVVAAAGPATSTP